VVINKHMVCTADFSRISFQYRIDKCNFRTFSGVLSSINVSVPVSVPMNQPHDLYKYIPIKDSEGKILQIIICCCLKTIKAASVSFISDPNVSN